MTSQDNNGYRSHKPYTEHKEKSIMSTTYEPLIPQSGVKRTFGYILLISVGVMSPLMALLHTFWNSILNLFGWGS